ncbi:DUF4176 domain-containing protein [Bombilactobacillus thymidiniphilus]|uniref:DUF4176 domain-containing protein n=1 Tax=Bombilactobacillus thymidiniphilus TaxID=2923363 RepID=A0ABY4PB49_9LACO|nr:DUF4176 domain-containing protein [Bombilactobacillus thymidiniphilus]UQS82985.1 DUF4176 domain-containing protein [Bombilactobacillus thymidiniphilus]
MNDTILPIGSIVTLQQSTAVPVMIINRTPLYYEKDKCLGYVDYSSVLYPEGLDGDGQELYYFNQEDIADILFLGYRDAEELEFENNYDDIKATFKYPKLTIPVADSDTNPEN